MEAQQLVDEILGGSHDDLLDVIQDAIKTRKDAVARTRSSLLRVGDRVRTTNVRPKYLSGVTGVIESKGNTSIRVRIDGEELAKVKSRGGARYLDLDNTLGVPYTCVEPA